MAGVAPATRGPCTLLRCVRVGLSGLLGLSVFAGIGVHAQQPQPASSDAALAAQLRTAIASDTAAFVVGHTDFRRYTTPGYCLAAVRHAVTLGRRTVAAQEALDTVRQDAAHDTLPASTRAVAKGCAARFPAATTPVAELPHLFQLAVLAEQDTLAEAVLARRLTLAKSPSAKAALLMDAEATYLHAEPARVTAAEAMLARLDALGTSAAVLPSRIAAHQWLMAYADSMADATRAWHEAEQVLTLARTLPTDSLRGDRAAGWGVWAAYQLLGRLAYISAPDSLVSLARQLQQDAKRTPSLATGTGKSYAELPLDSLVRRLSPVGDLPLIGQPTPPLHADLWFPAPGQARDTVLPQPGRVSLFFGLPASCYASNKGGGGQSPLDPIGSGCQRLYKLVRGWRTRYGARLDLTAVAPLTGTVAMLLTGPEPAADAVKQLQWYVFDYLKLPINRLAVQTFPMLAPLPAPDGQVLVQAPGFAPGAPPRLESWWIGLHDYVLLPFQRTYHPDAYRQGLDPGVVLTGPDGRCLYSGGPSVLFDAVLARALAAPAQPGPAPAAGPARPAPPAGASGASTAGPSSISPARAGRTGPSLPVPQASALVPALASTL